MDAVGWPHAHVAGSLGGLVALVLAKRGRARTCTAIATLGSWKRGGDPGLRLVARGYRFFHRITQLMARDPARWSRRPRLRQLLAWHHFAHPERIDPDYAAHMIVGASNATILPAFVDWAQEHEGPGGLDQIRWSNSCSQGRTSCSRGAFTASAWPTPCPAPRYTASLGLATWRCGMTLSSSLGPSSSSRPDSGTRQGIALLEQAHLSGERSAGASCSFPSTAAASFPNKRWELWFGSISAELTGLRGTSALANPLSRQPVVLRLTQWHRRSTLHCHRPGRRTGRNRGRRPPRRQRG
jgi:hypothetical protein